MSKLRGTRGSVSVLSLGLIFLLLLLTFLIVEMGAVYENYDHCLDILQRCCNSAVEANIDDAYRADRMLVLNIDAAKASFRSFVAEDVGSKYAVTIQSIDCTRTPPTMTVKGTMTFSTVFDQYDWDDLTVSYQVRATNYDLD